MHGLQFVINRKSPDSVIRIIMIIYLGLWMHWMQRHFYRVKFVLLYDIAEKMWDKVPLCVVEGKSFQFAAHTRALSIAFSMAAVQIVCDIRTLYCIYFTSRWV